MKDLKKPNPEEDNWATRKGLRSELVTEHLADLLAARYADGDDLQVLTTPPSDSGKPKLDKTELKELLTHHVHTLLRVALSKDTSSEAAIETALSLVKTLADRVEGISIADSPARPIQRLDSIGKADSNMPHLPLLSVNSGQLLVAAKGEPTLADVIKSELPSAHSIDLICAFLKFSGLRLLQKEISDWIKSGGTLRILTTTYLGATDVSAVEWLVANGANVRVNMDVQATRLHAKAWLFHRDHSLSTALVGSSNLSRPAMLDGLEWNVRLVERENPQLVERFAQVFNSYWEGSDFEHLPELDEQGKLPTLADALMRARSSGPGDDSRILQPLSYVHLEVRAWAHQQLILDQIAIQRTIYDHHRNLVVAATGTGKTIIAALDYKRLSQQNQKNTQGVSELPSLLFVAHRSQILTQALQSFRTVLGSGNFGELLVDGYRPDGETTKWRHVFASVQSLHQNKLPELSTDQFKIIIVDEFHHAEANTYQQLLNHFEPEQLLGLTATPERGDGKSILGWFGNRIAAELRLWTAIEQGLLVPFHYFGLHDNVSLADVKFTTGGYDTSELDKLYTGNDARVRLVLQELQTHVTDVQRMRALGFCVTVAHAKFMARKFSESNLPSVALTAEDSTKTRTTALGDLKAGRIVCIFTVDLFNEGVDIPELDTVLMLRPTNSSTLFQQQLGRGLRRHPGKAVLTVLDFVGTPSREFRFARKWQGFLGNGTSEITIAVNKGFPLLPAGCAMQLDRASQKIVLDNLKSRLRNWTDWKKDLAARGALPDLGSWLKDAGIELEDIYSARGGNGSWLRLCSEANLVTTSEDALALTSQCRRLLHVDDSERLGLIELMANNKSVDQLAANEPLTGIVSQLVTKDRASDARLAVAETHDVYSSTPPVSDELKALLPVLRYRINNLGERIDSELPFTLHAQYQRTEILSNVAIDPTDVDEMVWRRITNHREGIYWSDATQTYVFLVTIHKDDDAFKPSTRYNDYAISAKRFHWESQSGTTRQSPTGKRLISQANTDIKIVLFVRKRRKTIDGRAMPFVCLGLADVISNNGERPIALELNLEKPMSEDLREAFSLIV